MKLFVLHKSLQILFCFSYFIYLFYFEKHKLSKKANFTLNFKGVEFE